MGVEALSIGGAAWVSPCPAMCSRQSRAKATNELSSCGTLAPPTRISAPPIRGKSLCTPVFLSYVEGENEFGRIFSKDVQVALTFGSRLRSGSKKVSRDRVRSEDVVSSIKMPLLRRQPFKKQPLPENLRPNEEVFYCKLTKEVFRDYDSFFERVILCNSLVWTCQLTGRPSLTYLEAIESEERARGSLTAIPVALKRTLLYLARLTKRGRLSDLCDDVFHFVKDRFFVGEEVDAAIDGDRRCCKIVKVLPPQPKKRKGSSNGAYSLAADGRHSGLDVDPESCNVELDPTHCRYQVCDCEDPDRNLHVLTAADVLRKKGVYSREKNRLFLKHTCETRGGQWLLKDKFIDKYNVDEMKFGDIFAGSKPRLDALVSKKRLSSASPVNNNGGAKSKSKESEKIKGDSKATPRKKGSSEKSKADVVPKKKKLTQREKEMADLEEARLLIEERQKAREEQKLKLDEERKKKKEEKEKEREKLREERRIMALCLREWQKPRDDLECDDLIDLPAPVPIDCCIPNQLFGDAAMVLEFMHNFSEQLSTKEIFPHEFTFDLLEKALIERDVQGPLNDLLQLLLRAIFTFQEEEDEVEDADRKHTWVANSAVEVADAESAILDAVKAVEAAKATADWLAYYHGSLHKMTLDAFTLTEVLRLHLLTSGSRNNSMDYSPFSDPGILLRLQDLNLLSALSTQTVFDISPEFKLKILVALSNQLLSYYSLRDEIEDRLEKLRVAKQDLRVMQWAEQRREKEEAALKFKKKMEQKAAKVAVVNESSTATAADSPVVEDKVSKGETGKSERLKASKALKSAEEKALEEEKLAALELKQKQDFLKKEKELADAVAKLVNRGAMFPLGRDRAYRRFWMFNALPGLFVEDDDDNPGSCLPQPTPYNPNSNPYTSFNNSVTVARQKNVSGEQGRYASDKENEAGGPVGQTPAGGHRNHKLLSDNHPTPNGVLEPGGPRVGSLPGLKSDAKQTIFGMCNGEGDACDVHGRRTRSRWGFYPTAGHVESLIASLNPRGFREGCLKEILVAEKRRVVQSVGRCPVAKLNNKLVANGEPDFPREQQQQPEVRKSNRLHAAPSYPEGTTMHDFLELTLRDSILDMEEKIYAGGLGSVKVRDRAAWREAIAQQAYDGQCEGLTWGGNGKHEATRAVSNGLLAVERLTNGVDYHAVEKQHPVKVEPAISSPNLVLDMASALLQIYQGIEVKYLMDPLAPDKEGESHSTKVRHKSFAERWQDSLMSSSSLSQLFVHLATLEKCVAWSRSALNARCRICRRKKDAEHMLLCDGCDRGHHIYCLKPPLKEIPEGEWLCQICNPKEKSPRKSRKPLQKDVEDKETEEVEEEDVEETEAKEAEETGDNAMEVESFHETRSSRRKRPVVESDVGSVSDGSCVDDDKILNSDNCEVCGKGGHLICCDHCPLSYHLECINPPLRRVPRGIWDCPKCCEYKPAAKKSKPTIALQKYTKLFTEERNLPKHKNLERHRPFPGVKDESSPRRSSRNSGRAAVTYDKHSSIYDEDEWEVGGAALRKRSHRSAQADIPDEEYYGMRKRRTPPSRRGASMDVPLDFKTCDQLLTEMVRSEDSWPFLRPVGKKELPMYHEVVKRPMDFGTMRSKLNAMAYQNNKEFVSDVFLVFQNCILYNPAASIQYKAADRLGKSFANRVRDLKLNLTTPSPRTPPPANGIRAIDRERRKPPRRRIDSSSSSEEDIESDGESSSGEERDEEEEESSSSSEDVTTISELTSIDDAKSNSSEQMSECSNGDMEEEDEENKEEEEEVNVEEMEEEKEQLQQQLNGKSMDDESA